MQSRRRNSAYIETSYTGVSAFSSAPAPHTNALAAASVIGSALKANNHNPVGLEIPKVHSKSSRAGSMTTTRNPTIRTNSVTATNSIRNNSIGQDPKYRQYSLHGNTKQRLSNQRSAPNLNPRRSVSDFTNYSNQQSYFTGAKNVPKTIKRYVPGANGLVAVEVPNPKHPDNMSPQQKQTLSRNQSFRRSTSISNIPQRSSFLQQKQQHNEQNLPKSNSIAKNTITKTKILPNGTKVISTTTYEEYNYDDEFVDSYENFDGFNRNNVDTSNNDDDGISLPHHSVNYSNNVILNDISESHTENDDIVSENTSLSKEIVQLKNEDNYENRVKNIIAENEETDKTERENTFKSIDAPIIDTPAVEEIRSQSLAKYPSSRDTNNSRFETPDTVSSHQYKEEKMRSDSSASAVTDHLDLLSEQKHSHGVNEEINQKNDHSSVEFEELENGDDADEGDYVHDLKESDDEVDEYGAGKQPDYYTEEEMLEAQRKLDELVKVKEQEILNDLLANAEIPADTGLHDDFDTDCQDGAHKQERLTPVKSETSAVGTDTSDINLVLHKHTLSADSSNEFENSPSAVTDVFSTHTNGDVQASSSSKLDLTDKGVSSKDNNIAPPGEEPTFSEPAGTNTTKLVNNSMAQYLRPMINSGANIHSEPPTSQSPIKVLSVAGDVGTIRKMDENGNENENENNDAETLKIPKREPYLQAQIDQVERERGSIAGQKLATSDGLNNSDVGRRKSVLKNINSNSSLKRSSFYQTPGQSTVSDAYTSLETAQNTKLNSSSLLVPKTTVTKRQSSPTLREPQHANRSRSGSSLSLNEKGTGAPGKVSEKGFTPLAAASRAAQRHSVQPSGFESKRNSTILKSNTGAPAIGGVKAPNPKVEEAKKRILQNRPGSKRAKEIYELSKTRPHIKSDDLAALDDQFVRRSSFEKVSDPVPAETKGPTERKSKMASISLRNLKGLDYEDYERRKMINHNFKSRFADDNSDTDLPLPPLENTHVDPAAYNMYKTNNQLPVSSSKPSDGDKKPFKFKLLGKKKSRAQLNQSDQNAESKFEKFFTEPHGPGADKRVVSSASAATGNSVATDGKKKKGSRLRRLFG